MKKIILIAMTVLALFLSNCKKEANEETNNSSSKEATITLKIGEGNTKLDVDAPHVTFENGDIIYVASNGTYIGTLEYDGAHFVGSITDPTEGQPLHFFFLGNQNLTLTAGTTPSCYVNISDQTSNLPVISYAPSDENYSSELPTYTATLRNQCALVKFNVSTLSTSAICITGMNNRVKVDFSTNSFTYSQINNGVIRLSGGSGENVEKWAILFPQEALAEGSAGSAYSFDGCYTGSRPAIPTIVKNACLSNGISLTVNTNCLPTGALKGLFSVSANKQVYFSQGNLQYNPKFKLWQFAYPQYSILHSGWTGDSNVSSEYTSTYTGWIDMFGWGTSGTYHGAICHQPYSTDQTDSKYYAYGNASYNLYDRTGAADWGCNAISNGGEQTYQWRTPTSNEWKYLLNSRSTPSGIRYAKAIVNGIKGLILLPDNWDASIYNLYSTNSSSTGYSNSISASNWTDYFEVNGAVFLPAAGWRDYINVTQTYDYYGYYWASDCSILNQSTDGPYCLKCSTNSLSINSFNRSRHYGVSVRLVQDGVQE